MSTTKPVGDVEESEFGDFLEDRNPTIEDQVVGADLRARMLKVWREKDDLVRGEVRSDAGCMRLLFALSSIDPQPHENLPALPPLAAVPA